MSYNPFTVVQPPHSSFSRRKFRDRLLNWFDREKRSLPWRGERDPYRILVSEIMLQQTRVAVVKERYKLFLKLFPDVSRLARAKEESVLTAWSGLGYYRRARALHAAAGHIRRNGAFPESAAELAELPGIGRYTSAAVASIAFDEPVAVVDGNVKRVLDRLIGRKLSGNSYWQTAQDLLEMRRPGDFNQAMMELGATICLPGQPLCQSCPVTGFCTSSKNLTPQRATAKERPPVLREKVRRKKGALSYLLAQRNGAILLQQRPGHLSLMPGMWELPEIPSPQLPNATPILRLRHSITNTDYEVSVFAGRRARFHSAVWSGLRDLDKLPLTGLARKILKRMDLLG